MSGIYQANALKPLVCEPMSATSNFARIMDSIYENRRTAQLVLIWGTSQEVKKNETPCNKL
ncbi:hypothetical protein HZS_1597 [Henneguya salminicola]|nr:hypothetical protein HZS_1597 [Henneguya salminicola]